MLLSDVQTGAAARGSDPALLCLRGRRCYHLLRARGTQRNDGQVGAADQDKHIQTRPDANHLELYTTGDGGPQSDYSLADTTGPADYQ